ncbi:putative Histone binding protein RBBP4 or subunit C of CAF1 complex [Trypanosoma vivax]|nr:putative Histone binding protein RBBP4 or subunit C of CAF1 complex [Trypanosoma vivax]
MRRATKRGDRTEENVPTARRRLSKVAVNEAEEKEWRKQQRDADTEAMPGEDDEEWEDVSDEESDEYGGVDEPLEDEVEEEIVYSDDDDEDYAEFQREADAVAKGLKKITFDDNVGKDGINVEDDAPTVWRSDQVGTGAEGQQSQKLEYSNKAYDSFLQLRTEYPSLSFHILREGELTGGGGRMTKYPLSLTLVCGSQAEESSKNQLYVLRITNICRTKHDAGSDSDSDDSYIGDDGESEDEDDDEEVEVNNGEPIVHHRTISLHGTANRIRGDHHNPNLLAVWCDTGHVQVFDISNDVSMLCDHANWAKEQVRRGAGKKPQRQRVGPLFSTASNTHKIEGYGLDWSSVSQGVFASGDCGGNLFVWKPTTDGSWSAAASNTNDGSMAAPAPSIEEIQWSPTQADVLITTRVGGVVEVWDTRDMRRSKIQWQADPTDINVANWNKARQASHLLVTGADSGAVAIWDLRQIAESTPIQQLPWHRGSITSVEFSLHNESVLAVAGDDGQCTLWDLSLERDPSEEQQVVGELFGRPDLSGIPDQLMFQHQGLEHPKEAHWHPQIPGMVITTDYEGLHLFRPMNWRSLMK